MINDDKGITLWKIRFTVIFAVGGGNFWDSLGAGVSNTTRIVGYSSDLFQTKNL
jgi:hypothetical protein